MCLETFAKRSLHAIWVSGENMRGWKRQKNVLLPPTSVASNACDKKDAPVDRQAPKFSEDRP